MTALPSLKGAGSAKLAITAGALALASCLSFSTPASAGWHGHHGGHPHFHGGHPHFYRGGWHGRRAYGYGWHHHRHFYGGPVFVGGYYAAGPYCHWKYKWVPGPFGWHWAKRRVCFW